MRLKFKAASLLAAILAVPLVAGFWGLDFGQHWDETKILRSVDEAKKNSFLPTWYNYPSLPFDLALATALPDLTLGGAPGGLVIRDPDSFILKVRGVFLTLSCLAMAWIFAGLFMSGLGLWECALAASLLAFSWEFNYHSRWIAPDALMTQFMALAAACLFALSWAGKRGQEAKPWLRVAALAIGLSMASKYNAAIALPALWAACWMALRGEDDKFLPEAALCTAIVAVVFLALTPGLLFQPATALRDISNEWHHYQTGHLNYSITPGLPHLLKILEYLFFAAFSANPWISGTIFAFSLFGALTWIRCSPGPATIFMATPLLYLALMSAQHVMMVRNLLLLLPFMAILATLGISRLAGKLGNKPWILSLVVLGLMLSNGWAIAQAGYGIGIKPKPDPLAAFAAYEQKLGPSQFLHSPRLLNALHEAKAPQDAPYAALYSSEAIAELWPCHDHNLILSSFGPQDINLNYYPNWWGSEHIVVVSASQARHLGLVLQ